jgi:hypothetical protein
MLERISTAFSYWSGTTAALPTGAGAWVVEFGTGFIASFDKTDSVDIIAWCVRGGQGVDPQ